MLWLGARSCANTGASRLAYNRKHSEIAMKKRRIGHDLTKFNPWSASYICTHATSQAKALPALSSNSVRSVEMTEIGNPQNQPTGIPYSLGKRTERVSHIPTAPPAAAAKLSCSNPISERTFLCHLLLFLQAHLWIRKDFPSSRAEL